MKYFYPLEVREAMLEEDVIDEIESHGEEKLYEDWQYREEEGPPRNKIKSREMNQFLTSESS